MKIDFIDVILAINSNVIRNSAIIKETEPDLWELSKSVPALLINGERMLDFPRPLPLHIQFTGELGKKKG